MSSERFGGTRALIATEAARLMYEEGIKEYFTAKRMAAKRLLGRAEGKRTRYRPAALPSNGEIRDALLALASAIEGGGRTRKLFAMRVVALEIMQQLRGFEPRLIGSVSTGHVRRGSDIDVSVFTDDEGALELHLAALGWAFQCERVTIFKFGEVRNYLHYHVDERFPVELTAYPAREIRFRPRSSTDGKPIVRVGVRALQELLGREHPEPWRSYLRGDGIEGLEAAVAEAQAERNAARGGFTLDAAPLDSLDDDDEEPPCVAEPGEEDDPDQAYDPLPGFEHVGSECTGHAVNGVGARRSAMR